MMLFSQVVVCLENTTPVPSPFPPPLSLLCFSQIFLWKAQQTLEITRSWLLAVISPLKQMGALISMCQLPP